MGFQLFPLTFPQMEVWKARVFHFLFHIGVEKSVEKFDYRLYTDLSIVPY